MDRSILISVLGRSKSIREVKQLHSRILVSGLAHDVILVSKLLLSYSLCGSGETHHLHLVLHSIPRPRAFLWNSLIRGGSMSKNPNRAISHFLQTLRLGVHPDYMTFPFLVKSFARIGSGTLGKAVHCCVVKHGLEVDLFTRNSMIHMYAACGLLRSAIEVFDGTATPNSVSWNAMLSGYVRCGDMVSARKLFDRMPVRDVVSWSSLIDGYVKGGKCEEALILFDEMHMCGIQANSVTMVSVVSACAQLGALERGRAMHRYVEDNGLEMSLVLVTSLVDMYGKCGALDEAYRVFCAMPSCKTDILIWNAMIGAFAMHGLTEESFKLFAEMQEVGIFPDEITYLCLLSACAHGGRVNDAWILFKNLESQRMMPHMEHYACMVDVLGRSGYIREAYELIRSMPMEPSSSVLGALLSGCLMHREVELAEETAKKLVELKPHEDGRYIGLSNVYASAGRWNEARMARRTMEERGVKKVRGCSTVEVEGKLHEFSAHDRLHAQLKEICMFLDCLFTQMKTESDDDYTLRSLDFL